MMKQSINHLGISNRCSSSGGTVLNNQPPPPADGGVYVYFAPLPSRRQGGINQSCNL